MLIVVQIYWVKVLNRNNNYYIINIIDMQCVRMFEFNSTGV